MFVGFEEYKGSGFIALMYVTEKYLALEMFITCRLPGKLQC